MTLKVSGLFTSERTLRDLVESVKSAPEFQLAGHVGGADTLATVLRDDQPDVLILDLGDRVSETQMSVIESALLVAPHVHTILVDPNPTVEFMSSAMRSGVRQILQEPISLDKLREALGHVKARSQEGGAQPPGQAKNGKVLAFAAPKGGAGTTFLATNLAFALAEQGKRVIVIDLDLHFGDAAVLLGNGLAPSNVDELVQQYYRLDAALLEASLMKASDRLYVLPAPDKPDFSNTIVPKGVEKLIEVARSRFDYVVLDLSPFLDLVQIKAMDMADVIYLIVQLNVPFMRGAKRMAETFRELGYQNDKVNIVANRYKKGSGVELPDIEKATMLAVKHVIPNSHQAVTDSINQGIPLLRLLPCDPVSEALLEWCNELSPSGRVKAAGSGRWWDILVRT